MATRIHLDAYQTVGNEWMCNRFLYARAFGPASPITDALQLCAAFKNVIVPEWKARTSHEWRLEYLYAHRAFADPILPFTLVVSGTGLNFDECCPTTAAVLVHWATSGNGRSGYGRTYFGGVAESDQVAGQLGSLAYLGWVSFADLLVDEIDDTINGNGAWRLVCREKHTDQIRQVNRAEVRGNLATMRTRRRRNGLAL